MITFIIKFLPFFFDLKGFTNSAAIHEVASFEEYTESECHIVLLIIDSSYVTIYAKDQYTFIHVFTKAVAADYEKIAMKMILEQD